MRKKRKKRNNKKETNNKNKFKLIVIIILILIIAVTIGIFCINEHKKNLIEEEQTKELEDILKHYNKYVKTNKETKLYILEGDNFVEKGNISENQELELKETDITYEDKYLKIATFEKDYYVFYKDVDKIESLTELNERYKSYIPFNKKIKTKEITNFYDESDNLIYTFNSSFDLVVLISKEKTYGVEYNDRLLYVKKEDVEKIYDNKNTDLKEAQKVRTLAYHRIYDPKTESCNEVICHTEEQFESHIKYLKENGFLTLTTKELEMFIDGDIRLPKKSIVLTIDDGTLVKRAIPILEKYGLNASLFLVTSRFNEQDYIDFTSDNLELHSHTHKMHNAGQCAGYGSQGGGILCLDEKTVLDDLKASREKLNGSTVFCYPFYDYSQRAINLLNKAGFTMAFAGELNTSGFAYVGTNKMLIPRVTIVSYTSFTQFKNYVAYGFN